MAVAILLYAGLLALCFAVVAALIQWRNVSLADRILVCLFVLTVIQESTSFWMARMMHMNNMVTYHIYSPIEFFTICFWMSRSHSWIGMRFAALVSGLLGCLLSILNSVFLQPLNTPNTYFLLLEGAAIIQLSLTSIASIVMRESTDPFRMVHFWIALNFIFYWSLTLVAYGMIGLTSEASVAVRQWARIILLLGNILFYTALGIVFLRYKKLIPSGA
jgi:hypothetical protein